MNQKITNTLAGTAAFLAGGIIGSGVALLFAPQSGRKTRRQIERFGRKVKRRSVEMAKDSMHTLADAAEDIRDQLTTRH